MKHIKLRKRLETAFDGYRPWFSGFVVDHSAITLVDLSLD
jgi:hypothetical protein